MNIRQYLKIKMATVVGGLDFSGGMVTPQSGSSNISIDTGKGTVNGLDNMLASTPTDSGSSSLNAASTDTTSTDNNDWGNYDANAINNAADNLVNDYDNTIAGWNNDYSGRLSNAIDNAYGGFDVDAHGNFKNRDIDWGGTDPNQDIMSEMNSGVEYGPGYKGNTNEDGYKTEVGTLGNPVSSEAGNTTQQTSMTQNQPQRPSYQAMQQNKQELQAWDDHYNAIKQNIMNPGQISRWRANGFTDEQMNAYADREARKKATNRYGNRPNDIMEEYNYNMAGYNNQQQPEQDKYRPNISPEEFRTAINTHFSNLPEGAKGITGAQNQQQQPAKPQPRGMTELRMRKPNSDPNRLRAGNPMFDTVRANIQRKIDSWDPDEDHALGSQGKLMNRRRLRQLKSSLELMDRDGLDPDGTYNLNGTRFDGRDADRWSYSFNL